MKRLILVMVAITLYSFDSLAQNEIDALRYSRTQPGGTARFSSVAGAFGALGGDFSALSTNPAGLGLYKKSEFSFTPSFFSGQSESNYNGMTSSDYKHNFNMGNVGMVFTMNQGKDDQPRGWKNIQFAIGLNRINNFNNRLMMEGVNNDNSLLDTYVEQANGINFDQIEEDPDGNYAYDLNLAWWTYLLNLLPDTEDQYYSPIPTGGALQRKSITSWGSVNELVFSMGANYSDMFYIGGTIGFPFIRYFEESHYSEEDFANTIYDFKSFDIYDQLSTEGTGYNFKFGMIFKPVDWFRIGGAIHTPTFYSDMNDEWNTSISSDFDNGDSYSEDSPFGTFNYELETPMKLIGSAAFVIQNYGFLSVDYEFVDYSQARLRSGDYNFSAENSIIRDIYTTSSNLRFGGEAKFDQFALRGGYAIYGNPYKSGINEGEQTSFSAGFGFREKNYFLDFAYVRTWYDENYYFYSSDNYSVNPVKNTLTTNTFLVTLGFRY